MGIGGGKITYANVVATVALFLALAGGVAWALGRNDVKSKHIKPKAVKTSDLANDAVKPPKLGNVSYDEVDAAASTSSDTAVSLSGPSLTFTLPSDSPVTIYGHAFGRGAAGTTCELIGVVGDDAVPFLTTTASFPGVIAPQRRAFSAAGIVPAGSYTAEFFYRRVTGTGSCEFQSRKLAVEISGDG